jgi:hypothetical protein
VLSEKANRLLFSPDGKLLVASGGLRADILVLKTSTLKPHLKIPRARKADDLTVEFDSLVSTAGRPRGPGRWPGASGQPPPGPASGPPTCAARRRPGGGAARRQWGRPARWRDEKPAAGRLVIPSPDVYASPAQPPTGTIPAPFTPGGWVPFGSPGGLGWNGTPKQPSRGDKSSQAAQGEDLRRAAHVGLDPGTKRDLGQKIQKSRRRLWHPATPFFPPFGPCSHA